MGHSNQKNKLCLKRGRIYEFKSSLNPWNTGIAIYEGLIKGRPPETSPSIYDSARMYRFRILAWKRPNNHHYLRFSEKPVNMIIKRVPVTELPLYFHLHVYPAMEIVLKDYGAKHDRKE